MKKPRVGSACSGYGGFDLGFEDAGFEIAWQFEIDKYANQLLRRHWPGGHNHGDLNEHRAAKPSPVAVIFGGTPCQDLSSAGLSEGLDGKSSRLFYSFVDLADRSEIPWMVWENVPASLSSPKRDPGRDWEVIIERITGARIKRPAEGWATGGWAVGSKRWMVWRVLDAQYLGVPQRRRRVFIVASTRPEPAPGILFDSAAVPRHLGPGEEKEPPASCLTTGCAGRRQHPEGIQVGTLTAQAAKRSGEFDQINCGTLTTQSPTRSGAGFDLITALNLSSVTSGENRSNPKPGGPAPTLCSTSDVLSFAPGSEVRGYHQDGTEIHEGDPRVCTPVERERLMGIDDEWTEWGLDELGRRVEISTTQRVKLTGNGVVRPVAAWIARRLFAEIAKG